MSFYLIDVAAWGIRNDGTNPLATTQGINNALLWAYQNGYTYVKLPEGVYTVAKGSASKDFSENACIHPQNDTTLDLYGCVIQKETNGWDYYATISIIEKNNVTILGGKIVGDHLAHDYATIANSIHEGCIGIIVERGSRNITLNGVEVTNFPGYCVSLSGTYSQLAVTTSLDWEAGTLDSVTGTNVADANCMRMNKTISLASLATSSTGRPNTSTNGGYFCIWGNGYGSYGTRYDGSPVNLSKTIFELYCYDDDMVYKGKVRKRGFDDIHLNVLPAGTTRFKISLPYDLSQIIPSTIYITINAFQFSRGIRLLNCDIHDSFSLGAAITGAQQVVIENCEFYRIGNSTPVAGRKLYPFPMGIDIEDGSNINQHIIIRNNLFRDNESLHISVVHGRNIIIENNKFDSVTNGYSSGVVFQGSRGANIVSQYNQYNCVVGTGQGTNGYVLFKRDTFLSATLSINYESIYEGCMFEDVSFLLMMKTYPDFTAGTNYAGSVGTAVLPTVKNAAWLDHPLYYVLITPGALSWSSGMKYTVGNQVTNAGKVYQCTEAGGGNATNAPVHSSGDHAYADGYTWFFAGAMVEPAWATAPGSYTVEITGSIWQAFAYDVPYDTVTFSHCKFNFNKKEAAGGWLNRRGIAEFKNCKFSLNASSRLFGDNSKGWDFIGKNALIFRDCDFRVTNSAAKLGELSLNQLSFIGCSLYGDKAGWASAGFWKVNDALIQNCFLHNFDMKLSGLANSFTKTVQIKNNRIVLNKEKRVFGANNEGIYLTNFENVLIEGNKVSMQHPAQLNRPFTIYAEKHLKITDNYFESSYSGNKIELFGAFRNASYTATVPKVTAYIGENLVHQMTIQQDSTFIPQLLKLLGDISTDINAASVGTGDRMAGIPTSGAYAVGQILYHSAPVPGGYIGWVCTTTGITNDTEWTSGSQYTVNTLVNAAGNVYQCTVAGQSGSSNQPAGTAATEQSYPDGYSWLYIGALAVFRPFGSIL
ncbi:right-handed parallel beta-helix repeat-containing protein [Paenibacillus sp. J2TS4]|uniref:right-handed parallel beta-helix repeat-containing protein n=1 Tax=Paenibacillus sp. J2TS4 TaxID=2807194 RepID=UPI001B1D3A50|nr:right-handed parallel beta-helix repeat-containing protein [Paenibacillus sp. J2TS4]GIP31769.1 hypothetical protein J2TS4_09790 [Paenibacillus sp. J2TS4]